jgi:hypothetical protein
MNIFMDNRKQFVYYRKTEKTIIALLQYTLIKTNNNNFS